MSRHHANMSLSVSSIGSGKTNTRINKLPATAAHGALWHSLRCRQLINQIKRLTSPSLFFSQQTAEKYHTATLSCTYGSAFLNRQPQAGRCRSNQHRPVKFQTPDSQNDPTHLRTYSRCAFIGQVPTGRSRTGLSLLWGKGVESGRGRGKGGKGRADESGRRGDGDGEAPRPRGGNQPTTAPCVLEYSMLDPALRDVTTFPPPGPGVCTPTCGRAAGPIAAPRPMWRLSLSAPGPYVAGVALPAALCNENIRRLSRHCLQYMHDAA